MVDLENILNPWPDLAKRAKWVTIVVLAFVLIGVAVKVYISSRLKQAKALQEQAETYKAKYIAAADQADKFRVQADVLQAKYDKANAKVEKLRAELNNINVPPVPRDAPNTVKEVLDDLNKMGLTLVFKPSLTVKPSVAGLTSQDASTVWFWGKEAIRVPALEAKVEAGESLIKGLDKAKGLAESLADTKSKEAGAWHNAAVVSQQEAKALEESLSQTQKALKAERKMKIYYAVGAAVLTGVAVRR